MTSIPLRTAGISTRKGPERNLAARLWIYLREMFPLRAAGMGLLFFASAWGGIDLLSHDRLRRAQVTATIFCAGAATVVLIFLLLRVMDELKDIDTDRRLFPDRPVPRGDVQVQDLRLLGALIIAALFGLNFFVTGAVAPFLIVFGYASLMYRYFFLRRYLSQNILLSLVTHNPISYLIFLYVAGVYQNAVASEIDVGITPLLGVVFLSFFLSWEISRKIRQPGEETAYQTYSMLLGFRIALAIPVLLSATVVAILCVLYRGIISPTSRVAMLTALVIMTWAFVQVGRGKRPSLSLRMVMERFIMTVQSLLIVEGWLRS